MKKMNKKGFTLIELLAIIVILAIIAVITVPIILNIIDEARNGARKNSVIGYGKAVELAYTQYQYEASLGTGTNSHVTASTASDLETKLNSGKTIKVFIDNATDPVYLNVDFDGDKVVCKQGAAEENNKEYKNTIKSGIISLQGCTVNDSTSPKYSYDGGKATTPSATTPAS